MEVPAPEMQTALAESEPVTLDEAAWTPPSWDEVVREHADRVYRLAYRLTGNTHDAEDLTQETFIRVFRSLASYKPGTFEGWLHRITTNLFLDMARRRSRLRMEGLPEDTDRIVGDDPSPDQVYSITHPDPGLLASLMSIPQDVELPSGPDNLAVTEDGQLVTVLRPGKGSEKLRPFGSAPAFGASQPLGSSPNVLGARLSRRTKQGAGVVVSG